MLCSRPFHLLCDWGAPRWERHAGDGTEGGNRRLRAGELVLRGVTFGLLNAVGLGRFEETSSRPFTRTVSGFRDPVLEQVSLSLRRAIDGLSSPFSERENSCFSASQHAGVCTLNPTRGAGGIAAEHAQSACDFRDRFRTPMEHTMRRPENSGRPQRWQNRSRACGECSEFSQPF